MSDDTSDGNEDVDEFERLLLEVEGDPGCASFPRLAEAYRREGEIARAARIAERGLAQAPERLGGRVALALAQLESGEIADAIQGLSSILENIPEVPRGNRVEASEAPEPEVADERTEGSLASWAEVIDEPLGEPATDVAGETETTPEPEETAWEHRRYAVPLAEPLESLPQADPDRNGDDSAVELREDEIDQAFDIAEAQADQMFNPNSIAEEAMLNVDDVMGIDELNNEFRVSEHPVFATETMANLLEGQGDFDEADEIRSSIPQVDATARGLEEVDEQHAFTLDGYENQIDFSDDSSIASEGAIEVELDVAMDEGVVQDIHDARAERRARIIRRLEGWLANIRRDVA